MNNLAAEVCKLQTFWTNRNSPEMQRRGEIIRHLIPAWLSQHAEELRQELGRCGDDLEFEGRDGTGRKTEVPWTRFYSLSHSPNAREGWYCVYLFHAMGHGVYLALGHGSTRWENGEFKPRKVEELRALVRWARDQLDPKMQARGDLVTEIDLGSRNSKLGASYAEGTVVAKWYPASNIPTALEFAADARYFARMLSQIYSAQQLGRDPEGQSPDVRDLASLAEAISRPLSARVGRGQGFGLSADERRQVELRAMEVARIFLEDSGWTLKDVSAKRSYDYEASNTAGLKIIVEVKGTTSGPYEILLTASELAIHRERFPMNALLVVHGIELDRSMNEPKAFGGQLIQIRPWEIAGEDLTATAFRYRLPPTAREK